MLYGVGDGVNLVRMTWEWVGFEAYVMFFKWEVCAGLWEGLEGGF